VFLPKHSLLVYYTDISFDITPSELTVHEGDDISIDCHLRGNHQYSTQWSKVSAPRTVGSRTIVSVRSVSHLVRAPTSTPDD
jgi:hypothetical protein